MAAVKEKRQTKGPAPVKEKVKKVKAAVTVTAARTGWIHRGEPVAVGAAVTVRPEQADRLKAAGVVE